MIVTSVRSFAVRVYFWSGRVRQLRWTCSVSDADASDGSLVSEWYCTVLITKMSQIWATMQVLASFILRSQPSTECTAYFWLSPGPPASLCCNPTSPPPSSPATPPTPMAVITCLTTTTNVTIIPSHTTTTNAIIIPSHSTTTKVTNIN